MAGRTTIIISHDLHTVTDADEIVVLDGGAVSAVGTPRGAAGHLADLRAALRAPPAREPDRGRGTAGRRPPSDGRAARPRAPAARGACSPRWWTSPRHRSGWCPARGQVRGRRLAASAPPPVPSRAAVATPLVASVAPAPGRAACRAGASAAPDRDGHAVAARLARPPVTATTPLRATRARSSRATVAAGRARDAAASPARTGGAGRAAAPDVPRGLGAPIPPVAATTPLPAAARGGGRERPRRRTAALERAPACPAGRGAPTRRLADRCGIGSAPVTAPGLAHPLPGPRAPHDVPS